MSKKMSHHLLSLSLMTMLVLLTAPARAQLGITPTDPRITVPATTEMFPDATAVLMMDDIKFDVLPDGTNTFDEHDAIKILTQDGIEENATLVRMVDTSKSEVEILMARTIKANGKIINAGEPRYSPLAEGSEVYKSVQRFSLGFPDVEVGDIVEFHIRTTHKPKADGHFWATTYVQNPMPILNSSFTVSVPEGVYFQTATPGNPSAKPEEKTITKDGKKYRELSWQIANQSAFEFDPLAPKAISLLKRIEVSSFKDWPQVNEFLRKDWQEHSKYGESLALRVAGWLPAAGSVQERANELLKKLNSTRKVAGFLGDEPEFHSPEMLLNEKLVSSADATILASVSLAAAGIPNFPIATLGVSKESLEDELPIPEKINKIILEIPRAGKSPLWFDPDSLGFALESLPVSTSDTAALSWDPRFAGNDKGLIDLKIASAYANREELAVEGRLESSGRAELTVQFDRYGANALDSRQAARDIKAEGRDTRDRALQVFFRNTARAYGPRARLLSRYFELDAETADPFSLSFTVAVPGFAQVQDKTLLVPLPRFLSSDIRAAAKQRKRETPLVFEQPYQQDIRIHLIFPEGSEVLEAPKSVEASTPEAEFVATGRAKGNEVWYVGRLTVFDPWVEGDALKRSLEALEAATRSEDTILKVELAPGGSEIPNAEVDDVEDEG
jgi:uncharacterized protein DUF3857